MARRDSPTEQAAAPTRLAHLDPILAVEIVKIDDRGAARDGGEVGQIDRHRRRQIDLLLGPRAPGARRPAVEQPAREARRGLEPDAAVAFEPCGFLDLLLLRGIVQPDAL